MSDYDILAAIAVKGNKAEDLSRQVMENLEMLPAVLEGFNSKKADIKFKSAKILVLISQEKPELLYPHFDFFTGQLSNKNNILKWCAMDVVANLASVDSQKMFDELADQFFAMLYDGNLITAGHVVAGLPVIARAKPYLEDRITRAILDIGKIPLPTEECRNIIKGGAIDAFEQYFDCLGDKEGAIAFTRRELDNARKSTRKKAEKFLSKYENS